ncbi:WecB/TagA/CpsF family glycosyltransferase [Sphingomonas sp. SUN039]|uniref:WecB/TagA/CpsF family glycosyltransferase n=1 Tax=Sphingomonas sp. SUN039 TaxID=2937787 RepID=UPI002164AE97|nr:WecB/TagA/CpsF family glycosyltransferase [Sphingomonas sp. SUN039]UVO52748.1 WecB/TagA/CpsF family glycosyltransferase [Sphingomonas sp. SUN039]
MTAFTMPSPVSFAPRIARPAATLFGLKLAARTRADVADDLVLRALIGTPTVVSFVNAHCVNIAARDPRYRRALKKSDMLLPDGIGIRIAAGLAGVRLGENLNGTDLFPELCARATDTGVPIFLLGGQPGVAHAAGSAMRARFPDLKVAGAMHGFYAPEAEEAVLDAINASGAKIVLVGFGVPRQERWIAHFADALAAPVVMGVGGLFDYYAGRIPRAPLALRQTGLEWVWRLAQEPRRMARRYLAGNGVFLARACAHALAVRDLAGLGRRMIKRGLDVAAGTAALVILAPLLTAVAVAIRLEDGGPVLFRQTRIGRDGKPFLMLKFRSMAVDAEARLEALRAQSERDATCFKMRHDPRITRVGRFIRRFSIDELPQLLNVVGGSMALVGPRPALPKEVISYHDRVWPRLAGKPGITCTWQVSGRAEIPFEEQVAMDIAYLDKPSLRQDLALLARTIPAVVGGRGAY